jgi:surfeit locus 1 family protein
MLVVSQETSLWWSEASRRQFPKDAGQRTGVVTPLGADQKHSGFFRSIRVNRSSWMPAKRRLILRGDISLVSLKKWILSVLAISFAAVSISLGFWQLRRLGERRAANALLASRRFAAEVPIDSLPADTSIAHFRRTRVRGAYDYSNEIVLTLRGRNGSPGVNLITPLRREGNDTAVLVNRGWIYSPDGTTADTKRWREGDSVDANGFVEVFPTKGPFDKPSQSRPRSMRRLDRSALAKLFPYPIANYYVVLTDSALAGGPPRVEPASLDEGPHRNYAIQWFFFAAISIIGLVIFLRRT